ncbi:MAG: transporter substrate-binding domain-containing protein [Atopobiaceae bacterium]|nr:transporter substrate-binding domain-containing protein [Atopobiaceae bacterium]
MKLKTFGTMFVGAVFAASLVACGGSASSESAEASADAAEGKTYTIATDTAFAPFEYADASNNYVGIDMELLDAIAKDQGFDYSLNPVGFDAALQNVQAGQADGVIAGMSITEEREKIFDFSEPYYDSTVCCAVKSGSDIKALKDLKGKNVAVKNGTQSQKWADSIKDKYGFTTTTFDSSDVMYQDVDAGNSVACFEDTPVMSYAISQYADTNGKEGKDFAIVTQVDSDSEFATPYGFAVNKGENAELLKLFNDGLANIKANGTYDEIVNKYVKSTK